MRMSRIAFNIVFCLDYKLNIIAYEKKLQRTEHHLESKPHFIARGKKRPQVKEVDMGSKKR